MFIDNRDTGLQLKRFFNRLIPANKKGRRRFSYALPFAFRLPKLLAGVGGFEPPSPGSKDLCLTA